MRLPVACVAGTHVVVWYHEEFSDIDPLPASHQAPEQKVRALNLGNQMTLVAIAEEISKAGEV